MRIDLCGNPQKKCLLLLGQERYPVKTQREMIDIISKLELGDGGDEERVSEKDYTQFILDLNSSGLPLR